MKVGDIVKFPEEHHLSTFLVGPCIVDMISVSRRNRYHIKTLSKNSDGQHSMAWVHENEIVSISKIREEKISQLLK